MPNIKTETRVRIPDSIYLPQMAKIVAVKEMTAKEKLFEIQLVNGKELGHTPGQFVEVSVFGIGEAPISISSSPTQKGPFQLCVRAVGNVTDALHRLKKGSSVGIRGPFGRGFPIEELKGRDLLFVAGGLGIAPLRSLINYVLDTRTDYQKVTILYGCKDLSELLFGDEVKQWAKRQDIEYYFTVDKCSSGWTGNVGVITTLFPKVSFDPEKTMAVVVGPPIMYKFVLKELTRRNLPDDQIIMSLERRMKCGVGKCGHCQINNLYVCQDGPVFKYSEIKELKEAL